MSFLDILHLKSSNAVLVSSLKNYFEAKYLPLLASESGKRYCANASLTLALVFFSVWTDNHSLPTALAGEFPVCRYYQTVEQRPNRHSQRNSG